MLCLILVCFILGVVESAPLDPLAKAVDFMKKYGYLQEDDGISGALYTTDGMSDIIKNIQKFGAIEQTGVLDDATMKLMSSKRCGVKDISNGHNRRKRFAVASEGWNKRDLTYYISNWSPKLGKETVVRNIQSALDTWGTAGRLNFQRSSKPDADIIVAFHKSDHGDGFPFDGPGKALAHAFYPHDQDGLEGDIHFDDDEQWIDKEEKPSDDGTDFYTVALHELGHSLGLDHSSKKGSIMLSYYQGREPGTKPQLGDDDKLGMYQLYITRVLEGDYNKQHPNYDGDDRTTRATFTETVSRKRKIWTYPTSRRITPRWKPFTAPTTVKHATTVRSTYPITTIRPVTPFLNTTVMYDGDVETVDEHKDHDNKHHVPKNDAQSFTDICDGNVDAVAILRGELFVFRDEYIWRFKDKGVLTFGYPIKLSDMFPKLHPSIKKVDAAYQRPDGKIVIFTGDVFWVYDGYYFVEGSPRPLMDYGFQSYLNSIDAVLNWERNGTTYFFKNERFWRYNENTKTMDQGYPIRIEKWPGVPEYLDAVINWKDGATYFFKWDLVWKIDNNWVTTKTPLPSLQNWFGCADSLE